MIQRLSRRRFLQAGALASAAFAAPRMARARDADVFDDGNRDVPGGVAGDPDRVLVVGAGFAGLTAANALARAGVDVIVLEGRERLGGRTFTKDVGGVAIDMGASWIHNPIGNPMSQYAALAGVGQRNAAITNDLATFTAYDAISGLLTGPEVLNAFLPIRLLSEQDASGASNDIGLEGYVHGPFRAYGGNDTGNFPDGGYRRLVRAMASGLDVRLGQRVTRIELGGSSVVVHAKSKERGRSRRRRIRGWDRPGCAVPKVRSIERLGFGFFEKVGAGEPIPSPTGPTASCRSAPTGPTWTDWPSPSGDGSSSRARPLTAAATPLPTARSARACARRSAFWGRRACD